MRKSFITDQALQDGYEGEDAKRIELYGEALLQLMAEDKKYRANWNTFYKWDTGQRLWWIDIIEKQARAGLDTIGVAVVTRAVQIRLEG